MADYDAFLRTQGGIEQPTTEDRYSSVIGSTTRDYDEEGNRLTDTDTRSMIEEGLSFNFNDGLPFGVRALMSLMDTEEEQIAAFNKIYPEGDVKKTLIRYPDRGAPETAKGLDKVEPYSNMLLFRQTPDSEYTPLEPVGWGDMGEIADHLDTALYVGTGIGLAAGQPYAAGLNLAVKEALMAMLVRGTLEGGQVLGGVNRQDAKQVATEVLEEGAWGAGGSLAGETVMRIINRGRQQGVDLTDAAAQKLGLLRPGQIKQEMLDIHMVPKMDANGKPVLDKDGNQVYVDTELLPLPAALTGPGKGPAKMMYGFGARSDIGQEEVIRMQESAVRELRSLFDGSYVPDELDKILANQLRHNYNQQMGKIWSAARKDTKTKKATVESAGKSIETAMSNFSDVSRKEVNRLYNDVDRLGGDIEIGIQDAKVIAEDILAGTGARGKEGAEKFINVADPNLGALRQVAEDIRNIDAVQIDYNTVKELRTRLFDLIDNNAWGWRFDNKQAADLWGALTDSMTKTADDMVEQGVSGRNAEEFISALKKANTAHKSRMEVFQNRKVVRALKSEKADAAPELGAILTNPNTMTEDLYKLINEYAPEEFKTMKNYVYTQILQRGNASKTLNDWKIANPDSYKRMFGGKEGRALEKAANALDNLNSDAGKRFLDQQTSFSRSLNDALKSDNLQKASELIASVGKGNEQYVKDAILRSILDGATVTKNGRHVIQSGVFKKELALYDNAGLIDTLFSKEQAQRLRNIDRYTDALQVADAGVGIAEGATAGSMRPSELFKNPGAAVTGLSRFLSNAYLARVLGSGGSWDNWLRGKAKVKAKLAAKEPVDRMPLTMMSIGLTQISKDALNPPEPIESEVELIPAEKRFVPKGKLPPTQVLPPVVGPTSSIDSSYFEPQSPIEQAAAMPPPTGSSGGYMPPSMRQPGSTLGMMAQRQPVRAAGGGSTEDLLTQNLPFKIPREPIDWSEAVEARPFTVPREPVDRSKMIEKLPFKTPRNAAYAVHDYMAKDPYKDRDLGDYALDALKGKWYQSSLKHNVQSPGGYGFGAGKQNDATEHARLYKEMYETIGQRIPDNDPNMQGSLYDRSKNYAGGYDWGYRMARNETPEDAYEMARIYQGADYLAGSGMLEGKRFVPKGYRGPRNEDNMADAVGDYFENIAGVEQGIADFDAGRPYDVNSLVDRAMEWARQNRRKRIEIGKGRKK